MKTPLIICLFLIGLSSAAAGGPAELKTEQAPGTPFTLGVNLDPKPGPAGSAPYEMAARKEGRKPWLTFEDCTAWAVEGQHAQAALYRSQEQRLPGRDWCGKLVYRATGPTPSVVVRPAKPAPIPEPWDCIKVWNWGNVWCWAPDPNNPALNMSALVRGADGREHELKLGVTYYEYWFLSHAKLTETIARPAVFLGLRFANCTNPADQKIYLDSVDFYAEKLTPLTFDKPEKPLPFPTRQETILPVNKTTAFSNAVALDGRCAVFEYQGADAQVQYRLDLSQPFLDGLQARCREKTFYLCRGAQVTLENGQPAVMTLVGQELKNDILHLRWECQAGTVKTGLTADIRLRQKTLILAFTELSDPGKIAALTLGRAEKLQQPELIWIPYISYDWNMVAPHLLRDGNLFVFSHFDWYVSDASTLTGARELGPDWARYNGGAGYQPKTDGKRNPLRERLFLTVSPEVQEVFPTIPNPPSPMRQEMCRRQWRVKGGMPHAGEIAEAEHLRALGMEQVAIRYHEGIWRDGGESYTFRLQAAPQSGGDDGLRNLITKIQSLGWLAGTYTNYTDLAPVNSFWDEQWLLRQSDGNWVTGWARCYVPKPAFGRKMEAALAPLIQAKFGERHSYCDVLTAVPPFHWVDFDHRAPGAGTFRSTFENFGQIMLNERIAHRGPAFSEGGSHFWYAGLIDGNYGQLFVPGGGNPTDQPLFPDFDLLKLHPLEMDAGMGEQNMFYRNCLRRNYQQLIATTLAYGHLGFLNNVSDADLMNMYYMLQPLQEHYIMVPVKEITYDCNGRLLTSSQALADGGWRDSRLHVVYENGFRVWVNGSGKAWTVQTGIGEWTLPPWGYAACTKDGGVYAVSATTSAVVGNRLLDRKSTLDLSCGPESHYLNAANGFVHAGNVAGDGAAALKKEPAGWELIPARAFSEFGFAPQLVGMAGRKIEVIAVDAAGKVLAPPEVRSSRGMSWVIGNQTPPPFKYLIRDNGGATAEAVSSQALLGVMGQRVELHAATPITAAWWVDRNGKTVPATLTSEGEVTWCAVPPDFSDGSHVWLKLALGARVEWLDFVAAKAVSVTLVPASGGGLKTAGKPLTLSVCNRLARPLQLALTAVTDGTVSGLPATVDLGAMTENAFDIKWIPGETQAVRIMADSDGGRQTAGLKITTLKTAIESGNNQFETLNPGPPEHWGSNTGVPPLGTLTVERGAGPNRRNVLAFVNQAGQQHQLYSDRPYAATEGDTFKLSIFAKGKGSFKLALYAYTSDNRWLDCLEPAAVKINRDSWAKTDFSITIPHRTPAENNQIKKVNVAIIVDPSSTIQLYEFAGQRESSPRMVKE